MVQNRSIQFTTKPPNKFNGNNPFHFNKVGRTILILNKDITITNGNLLNIIQYKFHNPKIIKNPHLKKGGGYKKL